MNTKVIKTINKLETLVNEYFPGNTDIYKCIKQVFRDFVVLRNEVEPNNAVLAKLSTFG